ncbi:MAG: YaiO family outer membrane beta-barrel protein [Chitinophagaceae bacterium]
MKKLNISLLLILLLGAATTQISAQQTLSSDELFVKARKTAFDNKDYPTAIKICHEALALNPGYTDIEVFLGRLYYWSDFTDSAKIVLDNALQANPSHEDAAVAAASIAYFSNDYQQSINYCNKGLQYNPQSTDLLLQKAKCLVQTRQYKDALVIIDSLEQNPKTKSDARSLGEKISDYRAKNKVSVSYDYTYFQKQFDQGWHLASIDYSRQTKAGSIIGRVNYGNRFGTSGVQFEADAYPHIAKNLYAYVNVGYSPDLPIFPKFRSGFSLYANLPKGFEADAGFRYLNFNNDTWIYTGSVGKYYKNFWFNIRAYVTPDDDRISQSYSFSTRYYFSGADDYLSFSIGSGLSPDDKSQSLQLNSNYKLQTQKVSVGYRRSYKKLNIFYIGAAYANVEYQPKTRDNQVNISIGYQRRF